jgi:predicted transcriptional regulator of viral defense system
LFAKNCLGAGKLQTEYNNLPTLGKQAARLVVELYERGKALFSLKEVEDIAGISPKQASTFAASLVERGVITRLKGGLFQLVPFEMGRDRQYAGNPYLIARELAKGSDYYISHGSAMSLHQMATQPNFVLYTTTHRILRGCNILGTEFRFVRYKPEHMFGITETWVDKQEKVKVSDIEKTVIDGLKQPEYCGGLPEVAKGLWMKKDELQPSTLVSYALQLGVGAIIRRLGFLLELYKIGTPQEIEALQKQLSATYMRLDPTLPAEGKHLSRWKLQLNILPEELEAAIRT